MNGLTLVQTSPATNPDKNIVQIAVTGGYTNGTPDPLPLASIADPKALNQVPLNNPGQAPPPVTPSILNSFTPGYSALVQRTIANGITSFGLRWFQSSNGAELASGAYPAAITGGEIFLEIFVPTVQMA